MTDVVTLIEDSAYRLEPFLRERQSSRCVLAAVFLPCVIFFPPLEEGVRCWFYFFCRTCFTIAVYSSRGHSGYCQPPKMVSCIRSIIVRCWGWSVLSFFNPSLAGLASWHVFFAAFLVDTSRLFPFPFICPAVATDQWSLFHALGMASFVTKTNPLPAGVCA